ncbi:hypothetical protein HAZT_HAZT003069 [Hyalella azteca]|uniref:Endonuclease/exonuclease/phosphatase domain-containing protein n=1 Tax=Hyalella azteca TaxID=294128 RepID=A0A6A0H7P1_HYAAZ|nr:hypothetical protein HAZT_HAZT003069 [Hyalella azteca]
MDTPTRRPSNGQPTSLDISITSDSLISHMDWTTATALTSDHLPIHVTLLGDYDNTKPPKITITNFAKADWNKFTLKTEQVFHTANLPPDVSAAEKLFRQTRLNATFHLAVTSPPNPACQNK